MPFYDLHCKECDHEFNAYATITERTEKQIACPECGGVEHNTILKDGAAIIVKNSGGDCPSGGCCPGCKHAHG